MSSLKYDLLNHFRLDTGILGKDKTPTWIFGGDDFAYKKSMLFQVLEGIVEAAPQLALQMYIAIRNGLCLSRPQGKDNYKYF